MHKDKNNFTYLKQHYFPSYLKENLVHHSNFTLASNIIYHTCFSYYIPHPAKLPNQINPSIMFSIYYSQNQNNCAALEKVIQKCRLVPLQIHDYQAQMQSQHDPAILYFTGLFALSQSTSISYTYFFKNPDLSNSLLYFNRLYFLI